MTHNLNTFIDPTYFTDDDDEERDAIELAMARQQTVRETSEIPHPAWEELADHARRFSVLEARDWLRAARRTNLATQRPPGVDEWQAALDVRVGELEEILLTAPEHEQPLLYARRDEVMRWRRALVLGAIERQSGAEDTTAADLAGQVARMTLELRQAYTDVEFVEALLGGHQRALRDALGIPSTQFPSWIQLIRQVRRLVADLAESQRKAAHASGRARHLAGQLGELETLHGQLDTLHRQLELLRGQPQDEEHGQHEYSGNNDGELAVVADVLTTLAPLAGELRD